MATCKIKSIIRTHLPKYLSAANGFLFIELDTSTFLLEMYVNMLLYKGIQLKNSLCINAKTEVAILSPTLNVFIPKLNHYTRAFTKSMILKSTHRLACKLMYPKSVIEKGQ